MIICLCLLASLLYIYPATIRKKVSVKIFEKGMGWCRNYILKICYYFIVDNC